MTPQVRGPISGGTHGWAFGRTTADVKALGYVEEEFVVSGDATSFRLSPGTEATPDGRWQAEPASAAPYATRMLVYRPEAAADFNGTVIVYWNNVSMGHDLFLDLDDLPDEGFAVALVTTQRVGVHGLAAAPMGLLAWDPERYGSLSITSDDFSYDIFTQAASTVAPDRRREAVDPMGGLDVKKLVAMGGSQSAGRLAAYVNAIQPISRRFDGFLLTIYFGTPTPLEVGDFDVDLSNVDMSQRPGATARLRDDLGVPVFVMNSELEAIACYPVRQPDTDTFRTWEIAGTSHTSSPSLRKRAPKIERDTGISMPFPDDMNAVPITHVQAAAIHHLHRWVNGGPPAPSQPKIEFAGDPPQVQRDENGIAVGGIRLPQVELPTARHSAEPMGSDIISYLRGSSRPFPAGRLEELYPDRDDYLARFAEATRRAEAAGVLLAADAAALVEEAAAQPAP
jgi:hypothetical protein